MNKRLRHLVLVLLLVVPAAYLQAEWKGENISLKFESVDLEEAFRMFEEFTGYQFVIETDLSWRTLTMDVVNVPWDQAVALIVDVHGLEMTREGKTIVIGDPEGPATEGWMPRQVVLETRIYEGKRNGGSGSGSGILPVGGPMLVIDSVWVEDWLQQERMIQDTFGLSVVNLVSAPKIIVEPGETGSISVGSDDDPLYEFTLTAWPGESSSNRVRIRSEFTYKGVPFSETEVIATAGKPYLMGGREDGSGDYLFLSVLPRLDGNRVVSLSGKAVRVGAEGVEQPERIQFVLPVYPKELRKEGISGLVVLDVYIDVSGAVQQMIVLKADDDRLTDSAKRAVAQWRYDPARKEGRAVPAWMIVKVEFKLEFKLE